MRNDFQVDTSRDWAFQKDALAVRLRGRFAVAAPDLPKALRKLVVGGVEHYLEFVFLQQGRVRPMPRFQPQEVSTEGELHGEPGSGQLVRFF